VLKVLLSFIASDRLLQQQIDFMFWLRINLNLLEVGEALQFQFSCLLLKH